MTKSKSLLQLLCLNFSWSMHWQLRKHGRSYFELVLPKKLSLRCLVCTHLLWTCWTDFCRKYLEPMIQELQDESSRYLRIQCWRNLRNSKFSFCWRDSKLLLRFSLILFLNHRVIPEPGGWLCRSAWFPDCRSSRRYRNGYRFSWTWTGGWRNRTKLSWGRQLSIHNLCSSWGACSWGLRILDTFLLLECICWRCRGRVSRIVEM